MSEDDGFTTKEEIAKKVMSQQQADIQARREELANTPDEYMETMFDFHKFTADPNLKRLSLKLKEIDKNWILGNYNKQDEKFISTCEELITDVDYLLPKQSLNELIKTSLLRDIFSRISLSRGRKGIAAELFVKQISVTKAEISGLDKNKSKLLSFKRR